MLIKFHCLIDSSSNGTRAGLGNRHLYKYEKFHLTPFNYCGSLGFEWTYYSTVLHREAYHVLVHCSFHCYQFLA
uniref:Uncharacterized protein n=1 Tax=Arundo donax TaxID=35708 RepID=A0A0A9GSV0_ARUDO